jgi:hypothetical protein
MPRTFTEVATDWEQRKDDFRKAQLAVDVTARTALDFLRAQPELQDLARTNDYAAILLRRYEQTLLELKSAEQKWQTVHGEFMGHTPGARS